MKILLDTCEFLWLVSGDAKLSATRREIVRHRFRCDTRPEQSGLLERRFILGNIRQIQPRQTAPAATARAIHSATTRKTSHRGAGLG